MKVFVISIPSSTERRQHVTESLSNKDINFEFIDAVNGKDGKHPLLKRYDRDHYIINRGREAKPGELGCYASHFLAWEKACELNEPIVVLEDDLSVQEDFKKIITDCEQWIIEKGFIRIEPWRTKLFITTDKVRNSSLCYLFKIPQCTTGYIISPQCAQAFIKSSQTFKMPVDLFLRHTYLHLQPIYGVTPPAVKTGNAISIIGNRTQRVRTPVIAIKRGIYRASTFIAVALVNLWMFIKT
ncbi:glycosyltransferase family 25 protein [Vibrio rumoiensis]|uniref:Glycosyl transferase family 25 domain-containing protein n=1 Tax=Vibrio rumoiensis 1S-45 TaxID=1188252 RepID=A0A1E5E616_9VIBR|nr:glycosyltransferase family 25 protein [Vibrio rumoiensis]OEF29475.1 hypothetical protein A1QC_04320 [Vibrio rumoiensis 1S-45]